MADDPNFRAASNYLQMEDIATALGDMVLAWSRAELALINALAVMIGMEEYEASRIYSQLPNFHSTIKMLSALIEVNPKFDPLTRPVAKLSKLSGTRNSYIHGFYLYSAARNFHVVNHSVPEEDEGRHKPIKANDIHQHAHSVRTATKLLNERIEPLADEAVRGGLDLDAPDLRPHHKPPTKALIPTQ